jgi:hypothetical protein
MDLQIKMCDTKMSYLINMVEIFYGVSCESKKESGLSATADVNINVVCVSKKKNTHGAGG